MPKRQITVETGRSNNGITFRIRDESSGVMLAGFRLDREQVYDLTGGTVLHIEADQTDHLERIGKTMVVDSMVYARGDLKASTYDQMIEDAEQLARADRPGWDAYEARRTNTGSVHVTLRRWE